MSGYRWPRPYASCCKAKCRGGSPHCKKPKVLTWVKVEGGNIPLR